MYKKDPVACIHKIYHEGNQLGKPKKEIDDM